MDDEWGSYDGGEDWGDWGGGETGGGETGGGAGDSEYDGGADSSVSDSGGGVDAGGDVSGGAESGPSYDDYDSYDVGPSYDAGPGVETGAVVDGSASLADIEAMLAAHDAAQGPIEEVTEAVNEWDIEQGRIPVDELQDDEYSDFDPFGPEPVLDLAPPAGVFPGQVAVVDPFGVEVPTAITPGGPLGVVPGSGGAVFGTGVSVGLGGAPIGNRLPVRTAVPAQKVGGKMPGIADIFGAAAAVAPQIGKLIPGVGNVLGAADLVGTLAGLAGGTRKPTTGRKGKGKARFVSVGEKGKVGIQYADGTFVVRRVPRPVVLGKKMPSLRMWKRAQKMLHGYRKMAIQVVNRTGGMTARVRHKGYRARRRR